MKQQKVTFKNEEGKILSGKIELPADGFPHNFALFAHCFTCNKNFTAGKNISQALTDSGIGVLRFDFTGLGESEGDFADTNFSGNVEDLIAAANYLAEFFIAPTLLVGHSLGGAAVVFAASEIASVKAIVTIGAPSNPEHVKNLLKSDLAEIQQKGIARVNVGGRNFTIKKQFLDDLQSQSLHLAVKDLRKAILILHSPQDTIVGIKNAEEIYIAAHHPKSFVSLDGADHLLSKKADSLYVGRVISGWASRYIEVQKEPVVNTQHDVVASLYKENGFTTQMKVGSHYMTADEPENVGGNNFGPNPYEYVSAALAACTAMTLQMYAKRKKWDLQHVEVHTSYAKDYAQDCEACDDPSAKIDTFKREIRVEGRLDDAQLKKLLEIADKCPVHKTLHSETQIITKLL